MTDYNEVEVHEETVEKKEETAVKEKISPVVSKKVKKQKRGLMERLVVGVLGPDGLPSISSYIGQEIVVPAIKNIIVDGITSGINMMMFGGENKRPPTQGGYGNPTVYNHNRPTTNYAQNYKPKSNYQPQNPQTYGTKPPVSKRGYGNTVEEYIIADRHEAIGVLDHLIEQIVDYGSVSVADYYDMIGVEPSYTDNTYGWKGDELTTAGVVPTRGGYILKLPPVSVI